MGRLYKRDEEREEASGHKSSSIKEGKNGESGEGATKGATFDSSDGSSPCLDVLFQIFRVAVLKLVGHDSPK